LEISREFNFTEERDLDFSRELIFADLLIFRPAILKFANRCALIYHDFKGFLPKCVLLITLHFSTFNYINWLVLSNIVKNIKKWFPNKAKKSLVWKDDGFPKRVVFHLIFSRHSSKVFLSLIPQIFTTDVFPP